MRLFSTVAPPTYLPTDIPATLFPYTTLFRSSFLKKLKIELPYDPAIPLLGIYPEKTIIWKDTYILIFTAALFTITVARHGSNLYVHWQMDGYRQYGIHRQCKITQHEKEWSNALCFRGGSEDKASPCNAGDPGSIPGLGRSPGEGNGNPLQYPCLENPMDRGAWWAAVHRVAKSRTRLSDFTHSNPMDRGAWRAAVHRVTKSRWATSRTQCPLQQHKWT